MSFRAMTGTLVLRTPLHVGTGEGTETADDLVRRDVRGRLLIPGTAIAGALRSLATRLAPRLGYDPCVVLGDHYAADPDGPRACPCVVCRLFGTVNPKDVDRRDEESEMDWLRRTGRAARLWVYDAYYCGPETVQVRDGVGIDRATGVAARRERIKFDLEVLPAKATFSLRLELDSALEADTLPLLAAALAEWRAGRGVVGGRVGRGLGAFKLDAVTWIEKKLEDVASVIQVLEKGPWKATATEDTGWLDRQLQALPRPAAYQGTAAVARSWALAEFTLAATGPFLTHDLTQAGRSGFDHAPLLDHYQKHAAPVLSGSSLRGVLRSQAERIARTLATLNASERGRDARQAFLTTCPACNPLASDPQDELASCNSLIKKLDSDERKRLERFGADKKLCLACRLFGSTWNGSRLRVEDAPLKEGTPVQYKVQDFLAIDRFTGGGRESAKFDAVALWQPRFSVRLFLENPAAWELGWLALVLRDLDEGLVTVGFGAAKGFGQCRIEDRALTLGFLHERDVPWLESTPGGDEPGRAVMAMAQDAGRRLLGGTRGASGVYTTVAYDDQRQADWVSLANGWAAAFIGELKANPRPVDSPLASDSYFTQRGDDWLAELYPVGGAMSTNKLEFRSLIGVMQRATLRGGNDPRRPTVWGGQFEHDETDAASLTAFLDVWRQHAHWPAMPFRVWEYVSEIHWAEDVGAPGSFTDPRFLLRAEIFGEGGHLSLRRDGARWLWHYVGPAGQTLPPTRRFVAADGAMGAEATETQGFEVEDFWDTHANTVLRCYDNEQVLLWGEELVNKATQEPTGVWWEDRVAASTLEYPAEVSGRPRVQLSFSRFTEDGQTAFIWYRKLE